MNFIQKEISIKEKSRGFHLITEKIISALPEMENISAGILNIFIKHTSASLSINENASPDVRRDLENYFSDSIPEGKGKYEHNYEGYDDMPAHIKNVIIGSSLSIPVSSGRLNLGTWQGIYLCEHRNSGGDRKLVLTLSGILKH